MDLEGIVPSRISQRKTNNYYVESKEAKLTEIESRIIVARGWDMG